MRLMISPVSPRPTASGLMIASVLSIAIRSALPKLEVYARKIPAHYFLLLLFDFDLAADFFFAACFDFDLPKTLATVWPISAGLCTVWMPAARMAAYFSAAVPWPPLMIAPAWPMRRPGGAVCPAMKPTTGFFTWDL